MDILLQAGLIILALSILVTIHELGHFWAARIFKMRVESFALFFGPILFKYKPKNSETEYQLRSIPLGGFVKISGMLDESMDKEQMKEEPKEWEFRSKPRWQRLIVMLGGIIMNVILGFIIFIGYKWSSGDDIIPMENLTFGIEVPEGSASEELGFKTGDKLLKYRGEEIVDFGKVLNPEILVDRGKEFTILRNGKEMTISVPDDYLSTFTSKEDKEGALFYPDGAPKLSVIDTLDLVNGTEAKTFAEVDSALKDTFDYHAWKGGLRDGDLITMIDSTPVKRFSEVRKLVKPRANDSIQVTVQRMDSVSNMMRSYTYGVKVGKTGKIGISLDQEQFVDHVDYSFGQAIPVGIAFAWDKGVKGTLKGLFAMVSGNANPTTSMSGPVKISKFLLRGFKSQGWSYFWFLTAYLSMVLAVMNLLPIPVLDGGHVLFLIIESIIGRDLPDKIKEWAMNIGLVMILLLMGFVILNDVINY